MTPQTVPSSPMNGPPATAVERMIMPFSSERASELAARSSATRTDSNASWLILAAPGLATARHRAWPRRRGGVVRLFDVDRVVLEVVLNLLGAGGVEFVSRGAVKFLL